MRSVTRLLAALALFLGLAGSAWAGQPPAPFGRIATGSTAYRNFSDAAADVINVKDFGAYGDTKSDHPSVTVTAGSPTLTISSSDFVAGDVGKHISVDGAGLTQTVGSVTSIPVTAPGSAYTTVPLVSLANIGSGTLAKPLAHMELISGTVASGGSGCTAGSQTFTLDVTTTGGRAVAYGQVMGMVASGALSGTLSVAVAGDYLSLPTNTAAITLTGGGCTTPPTLNGSFGVLKISMAGGGVNYPPGVTATIAGTATLGTPVVTLPVAPLSTTIIGFTSGTQITLGANASTSESATTSNIAWGHDDTAAFASAISYAATFVTPTGAANPVSSHRMILYAPAGDYTITSPLPQMASNTSIKGDGQHISKIRVDAGFSGDLFWWSDAWLSSSYTPATGNPTLMTYSTMGPTISDLEVIGNRSSINIQNNAFSLYDHDDAFSIHDVQVDTFPGRAFYLGAEKNDTSSYTRETHLTNIRMFNDGSALVPVLDITTNSTGDTTNTDYLSGIDIYAPGGTGVWIHAPSGSLGPRGITGDYMRIEGQENIVQPLGGRGGDLLEIGDPSASVSIHGVDLRHLVLIDPYEGSSAVHVTSSSVSYQPYSLYLDGGISGTSADYGSGIQVDFARTSVFHFPSNSTIGYEAAIAANAGAQLYFNGDGNESGWIWNIDPSETALVQRSVQSNGNPSNLATDLQTSHSAATQYGSGLGSFTGGSNSSTTGTSATSFGVSNQTSGTDAVSLGASLINAGSASIALGQSNQISSSASFVAGSGNSVTGGGNETVSGHQDSSTGTSGSIFGSGGNDRGRYAWFGFSGVDVNTQGDHQFGFQPLGLQTSGNTPTRLTADKGAANSVNTVNLPSAGGAYGFSPFVVTAFDPVNIHSCMWTVSGLLVEKGGSAASTVLVGTPTITQTQCDSALSSSSLTITADTTLGALNFGFTGIAAFNLHVLAVPMSVEQQ